MSNSKETMTKKQQDDLASTFNNLPWSLPMGFSSMSPFGAYPPFGLPTPNFPSLNSFTPSTTFPSPLLPSLLTGDPANPTTDMWSNGLANTDYNEYAKQLGLLMNAFNQKPVQSEADKSKTSPTIKSSKSKRPTISSASPSSSSEINNGKVSTLKTIDESHPRSTSTSSSSSSSTNLKKSSTHSKSSHSTTLSSPSKAPTNHDSSMLDPLTFAAAAAAAAAGSGNLPFPYFLPSLLSQPTSTPNSSLMTESNNNSSTTSPSNYPFSSLSSSLMNPAATLYPFLSPDWFSASKFMEGFGKSSSEKSIGDSKESTSHQPSKSKHSQKHKTPENKHLPTLNSLVNDSPLSSSKSKKRAKSIRTLTEEQELNRERLSPTNQTRKTNPSLLHSALTDSTLSLSRRNSANDTPAIQSADESRSNDDDDSDPNPKRRKTEEVNEALIRIPLSRGWKRVTIVRAITRTGVRGDISYYAPCGRKLRSFQEIDRYLAKKNITDLDRSHFTFSSKVHIGHFHEPKEGPDGKTIFHESTEDEIIQRILEINSKFRRNKPDYDSDTPVKTSTITSPSLASSHKNGTNDHHQSDILQQMCEDNRKLRLEQEEMAKRAAEIKTKREAMRLLRSITGESSKSSDRLTNAQYQHNDFLKAIIEQQKFVQQQEIEHQQKLQQEQQEQERKRQELAYFKQLELKKRQEEKLQLIEQRKAEKNAEREKKIQERYMEIVLAKETKRVAEDMQLKDLKPLPILKPVENTRLSIEAFANSLMVIQFLTKFKHLLSIPENLLPTLNTFHQSSSSRDINTLCQLLLSIALDDPGIPNPKKGLTNLGQKLSEIDITEHTFSEILRLYIRERNGFDDKITQCLSDASFQSLAIDEKIEILAFLCNDLSANKRVVEEVDRNLDELTVLKHEKFELEKRLRRLKFEKFNTVKKVTTLIRDKDVNSSDNESPDESDGELTKNEDGTSITNDPAAVTADDQDIETIDETKIDDLDKRLTLVTRKYTLVKRRVIEKHSQTRALHLGQDRYRRRYWYFSHLPGIYVEGLTSGDISPNDIKDTVQNAAKQKLDKTEETNSTLRSVQRKKQSIKVSNTTEQVTPIESTKIKTEASDNEDEPAVINESNNGSEDLATMDLSAFCMASKRDDQNVIPALKEEEEEEVSEDVNNNKRDCSDDNNLPLDLSCSKPKRSCDEDYWTSQDKQTVYPSTCKKFDTFPDLNGFPTSSMFLSNIKQESIPTRNILDLTKANPMVSPAVDNYKQIEQTIREKFQYSQPLPIPEDVQTGWWIIQTSDELRTLMKSLAKRGQRERYLCRMFQRYFDVVTNSMKLPSQSTVKIESSPPSLSTENDPNEQTQTSSDDFLENETPHLNDNHEMDVLNEIYNLSDRIIASSLHCRSYDTNISRKRLTSSDIQAKGSDILDEGKHLLTEIERNIERRYLKHPFVRKYEVNLPSLNRINQNSTYHHTIENSTDEVASSSKHDEVPQQLERWRRTVNESRTPAQLALCLTQLERCIAWERSIMRVYCEICNSDNDEEKLLLCDGCDHGTHTYCFLPPMSFIPPNDWYCYVCIGKAKGENLCFVCGNKGDQTLNRCEHCGKLFHEDCLKNAKQQRGKWLCVLCSAADPSFSCSSSNNGTTPTKSQMGRQTSRSINSRQPSNNSSINGDSVNQSSPTTVPNNRNRTNTNRKSKANANHESPILQESHSNSSHPDPTTTTNPKDSPSNETNDTDHDADVPTKRKSSKKPKGNNDAKCCKIILNELLKSDVSWPFQSPVDVKEHPEYLDCIQNPMDFSIIKKKMRNNQYTKREDFLHDVELIINNCDYYNEDDSPVGQAGHLLRTLFQTQWTKQFG